MQYICLFCEAVGASGERDNTGPATYNCHVCGEQHGMWPKELAQKHLHMVGILRGQGSDVTDRLMIARLQRDLNSAKEKLRDQAGRFQYTSESQKLTIQLGLKIIDQILPQMGGISVDVGAVNDFCMRARQ
jgi:hypothetical protein